jgi:hypothetical protein
MLYLGCFEALLNAECLGMFYSWDLMSRKFGIWDILSLGHFVMGCL